jgi:hypothetical protein
VAGRHVGEGALVIERAHSETAQRRVDRGVIGEPRERAPPERGSLALGVNPDDKGRGSTRPALAPSSFQAAICSANANPRPPSIALVVGSVSLSHLVPSMVGVRALRAVGNQTQGSLSSNNRSLA